MRKGGEIVRVKPEKVTNGDFAEWIEKNTDHIYNMTKDEQLSYAPNVLVHKIMVTGGAGFIGSHVVDEYLNQGHEVAIVDNFSTGVRQNADSRAVVFAGDIRDRTFVHQVVGDFSPTVINHHAAQISVNKSLDQPIFDNEVNVLGTLNLLEESQGLGLQKFIFASSGGAIYGDQEKMSDEPTLPQPISPYGVSKLAAEGQVLCLAKKYGFQAQILRYSNVYGPRQNILGEAGVIAIFIDQIKKQIKPTIYGDGNNTRDFVFVKDVARANGILLASELSGVWNISTGEVTSINQLFQQLSTIMASSLKVVYAEPRVGDVRFSQLDNSKAARELGWQPQTNLEAGLKQTIEDL